MTITFSFRSALVGSVFEILVGTVVSVSLDVNLVSIVVGRNTAKVIDSVLEMVKE